MPIYEYRCKQCNNKFDALQSLGADGKDLPCPECGEKGPERLISVFAASGNEPVSGGGGCSAGSGFT